MRAILSCNLPVRVSRVRQDTNVGMRGSRTTMESVGARYQYHSVTHLQRVGWCPSRNYSVTFMVKNQATLLNAFLMSRQHFYMKKYFIIITSGLSREFNEMESCGLAEWRGTQQSRRLNCESMFFAAPLGYPLVRSSPGFSPRR